MTGDFYKLTNWYLLIDSSYANAYSKTKLINGVYYSAFGFHETNIIYRDRIYDDTLGDYVFKYIVIWTYAYIRCKDQNYTINGKKYPVYFSMKLNSEGYCRLISDDEFYYYVDGRGFYKI